MDRSFVLQSSSLGSRHKSAGYFSEGKMWRWAASGSNRLVNITTPTCLRHYTSPPEETPFHVITAASAILFRPSVFALASSTCRPPRSGARGAIISRYSGSQCFLRIFTRVSQPADLLLTAHQAFLGTCGQHARGWPMPRAIP